MSRLSLRVALASYDEASTDNPSEEHSVVMKGPLAEAYTQALDIAYAKKDPAQDQPAMETQAIDATIAKQVADLLMPASTGPSQDVTVYGVSEGDLNDEEVVNVTQELVNNDTNRDFVLVIDGTQPGANAENVSEPQERLEFISSALECLVEAHGGKVLRIRK